MTAIALGFLALIYLFGCGLFLILTFSGAGEESNRWLVLLWPVFVLKMLVNK